MEPSTQPNDIAREAIKRLTTRKQPPTPDNFRRAYHEVQGLAPVTPAWTEAIRALLAQWETYQAGLTQAKKRDMLDRVLINFGNDPDQLAGKIAGLARSWAGSGSAGAALDDEVAALPDAPAASPGQAVAEADTSAAVIGRLIGHYLEEHSEACRDLWPDLAGKGESLARLIAERAYLVAEPDVEAMARLWREMLVRAEDDHDFVAGLQRVLSLLFANIGELVSEDAWLSGQMATMQSTLSDGLNPHALFQAEESLKDLVQKQKQLKGSLNEAKEKLKRLISTFINRVGEMSESTGNYNTRIKGYATRIAEADDISQLSEVIDGLSTDMTQMEDEMGRSHRELVEARSHVEEAETRIQTLEKELETVSALVREDQMTGALNRRGMEEAFKRELARAGRMSAPFSVGLLDIDHFKRLNDSLGHQAGDQALIHLVGVVRQLLRPTDTLARYGGEEFLLLLPNSDLDEAEKVMLRLQRELTRQFFLHDNQKVLITFSAGVAQLTPGELQADLLRRADAAMYKAKATGRNRVERG
ncbi:MAG: diguanylate cyclase [Gallionellaceae bacterium]|nr:diguanylate cyclase [Gallionellaceae bacterium]